MKKLLCLSILCLASLGVFAQIEFGIQFSPTLSTTRINAKTTSLDISNFGSGIRFNAGPIVDIFIKDNVAVSSGLFYAVKRAGFSATSEENLLAVSYTHLTLPTILLV